jgi:chromosome segregation ATPase
MSKLKEELIEFEQKLIRSPERIQAETKEKEIELENKRNEKRKQEKQYMELMRTIDHLRDASKGLKPSLDTFTEAFREIEKIRSQCDALNEMKVSAKNKEKQFNEFKIKLREHETSLKTLKQQLTSNEKQYQQRLKTAKQLNNGLKQDLDAKIENQSESDKISLEQRIKLEKKLEDLKVEHQNFKDMSESYDNQHINAVEYFKQQFNRINDINKCKTNN